MKQKEVRTIIGIYKITNKVNGNAYIGQSVDIQRRLSQHFLEAFKENRGDYNTALHRAIRKYGRDAFCVEILEECQLEELEDREVYWVAHYDTYRNGYNMTTGGRQVSGESHGRAKLLEGEVIEIRQRWAECNISTRELYYDYQDRIGKSGFKKIYSWQTWKNILPELNTQERRDWHRNNGVSFVSSGSKENHASILTKDEVCEIRLYKKANQDVPPSVAFKKFSLESKIKYRTFLAVWHNQTWKEIVV